MTPTQFALLLTAGVLSLVFAVFHLLFWRLFKWREELARLTPLNRAVMQVLNLCLTFVFILFALVLLRHSSEMVATDLGRTLLGGIAAFWVLRAIEQVYFFGARRAVSLGFTLVFLLMAVLHTLPLCL